MRVPENLTVDSGFMLLGLFSSAQARRALLPVLVLLFVLTVTENAFMILLICRDPRLHTPMYFLLSHLSGMDILHSSNIVPKMVADFVTGSGAISFAGCGVQVFLSLILLGGECLLLAAMSCDRYVAICHPLRYPALMNHRTALLMAAGAWLVGTLNSTVHTACVLRFPFCSRAIDHFFCEVPTMLKLSCVDTARYERGVYVSGIIFLLVPFAVISASYGRVLLTVLAMRSAEARRKAFSTCSFHMLVVVMYYGPFIFTYMRPKPFHSPGQDKALAVFYTVLTPALNPLVYSFRNKDVLAAVQTLLKGRSPRET
ncbi:olfactory receptor 2AJ1 [Ochotona curzoniae]|uniref:olfactory receptor 2AJ1 n=1 Tax=Ochotona curzoniae TaxID=130825 RepID=UPI001B351A75|nr:olfactory receptor 2AJ1 [Ochotona curzoniae]